jgi:ABC-type glycerol-3-phosphate transport system substrate-binding protein
LAYLVKKYSETEKVIMKFKKVNVAYITAVVAVALSLPVGAQQASAQETLEVWSLQQADGPLKESQAKAVKDFEAANNVKVNFTTYPYVELRDKLLLAASSNAAPDVMMLDQIWVAQYAGAGYIDTIDARMSTSTIKSSDYFPGAWDSGFVKGKQYTVPFDVGVWGMLYYNKDMFKAAGLDPNKPPTTWDDLTAAAKKLTIGTKQYGIGIFTGPGDATNCVYDAFVFSGGGTIVNSAGTKTGLGSKAGLAALEQLKKLVAYGPKGVGSRDEEQAFSLFTSKKTAMAIYGEWGQSTINTRDKNLNYGVGLLPAPKGGKSVGTFGGFNLGISAKSTKKDLAWKFIQYASGAEKQLEITMLTPAHKASAATYLKANRKFSDTIYKQLNQALYRPLISNYPDFADAQRSMLTRVLSGAISPKAALKEGVPILNTILAKS